MGWLRFMIFAHILAPLIERDQRLRAAGKRPDRWYWADRIALRWGY
jgi:hypothetical protein